MNMESEDYFWSYSFPKRKGILDNDYYFMNDGKILHEYDQTINKFNISEYVNALQISEHDRKIMYDACPEEYKEKIKSILKL